MSFSGSISQCGQRDQTCWEKRSWLDEARIRWERAGAGPTCAAECDSGKEREVKWERKMSGGETKAFWLRLRVDEKWILARLGLQAWSQSAFKCIFWRKQRPKRVLLLHHPPLCSQTSYSHFDLDGLLLWILMKKKNPPLPEFPLYTTSSFLLSPSIVTCL